MDAAQAGGVRDQAEGGLDVAGLVGAGDVEGEEAADARRSARSGLRGGLQAPGQLGRGLRLPVDARLERLEAAEEQGARVGRRDDARAGAELLQALGILLALADDCAEHDVVVAAEVFRRAVQDEVGAVLERPQVDRRRGGGVDDDACRMCSRGLEVGHREEGVRRRFEPDEVDAVGRRAGLVELDDVQAPAFELAEEDAGSEVGAFGERDRVAGGEEA